MHGKWSIHIYIYICISIYIYICCYYYFLSLLLCLRFWCRILLAQVKQKEKCQELLTMEDKQEHMVGVLQEFKTFCKPLFIVSPAFLSQCVFVSVQSHQAASRISCPRRP